MAALNDDDEAHDPDHRSALIILALILIVIGLKHEQPVVCGLGLLFVAAAMIMSLATRGVGSGAE